MFFEKKKKKEWGLSEKGEIFVVGTCVEIGLLVLNVMLWMFVIDQSV